MFGLDGDRMVGTNLANVLPHPAKERTKVAQRVWMNQCAAIEA
jgi:hypothetical protein